MRTAILLSPVLMNLALLASCSSPPKPPTVDEANKRPVNSSIAVELQVCKNELHNTHLFASESNRVADAMSATLASIAAQQQVLESMRAPQAPPMQGNAVLTIRFSYGSTRVELPAGADKELVAAAKSAPLVMLRGRTDGQADTPAESRIARGRAAAVRDYLVVAGVDPSRIRTTYQPSGDHVAENVSAGGQALNRRVEIEVYRVMPVALSVDR